MRRELASTHTSERNDIDIQLKRAIRVLWQTRMLRNAIIATVSFCVRHALVTVLLALVAAGLAGAYAVTHFALDGATAALQRLREALNEQSSSAEHDRKADKERPSRLPARRGEPSSSA